MVTPAVAVARDCEERGCRGFRRHDAGSISERLRVDPIPQPNGEVLRFVIDCRARRVHEFEAEDQCVFFLEPPHVADHDIEVLVVTGEFRGGVHHADERIRAIPCKKWIGLRLVHERKKALRRHRPRSGFSAILKKRDGVNRLRRRRQMQDVGLAVIDDRKMILGLRIQPPDREIRIPRRERDEEIGIRLFLDGNRLSVEPGNLGRKKNRRIPRIVGDGQIVDDEFIERLLRDGSGGKRPRSKQRSGTDSNSKSNHAAMFASLHTRAVPGWEPFYAIALSPNRNIA